MPMRATTVISSISVKPARRRASPGVVGRAIEGLGRAPRVDVPDVIAAPGVAVRLVLVASHTPLPASGHRVHRDAPEELELALDRAHAVDARDERLQVARVALAAQLDVHPSDEPLVHRELVAVDGGPDLAQRPAQLELLLPPVRHAAEGEG